VEGIRFAQDQLEALYRGSRMTAHMGMFAVKGQVYGFMGSSPVVVSNPRFEPVSMT